MDDDLISSGPPLVEVQDFRKFTDRSGEIYGIYPKWMKAWNGKMSACNWLDLESLGSWPTSICPKLPSRALVLEEFDMRCSQWSYPRLCKISLAAPIWASTLVQCWIFSNIDEAGRLFDSEYIPWSWLWHEVSRSKNALVVVASRSRNVKDRNFGKEQDTLFMAILHTWPRAVRNSDFRVLVDMDGWRSIRPWPREIQITFSKFGHWTNW